MVETRRTAAANAEAARNQAALDAAAASSSTTPSVPGPTTPSSTPPAPSPFVSESLDPTTKALLEKFKVELKKIQSPTSRDNLFPFVYSVRTLIESSVNTKWLLQPLEESTATSAVPFSIACASAISELVPAQCVLTKFRPAKTHELFELLKMSVPSPFFRKPRQMTPFPLRNRTEMMTEYLDRVDLWVARYSPIVDFYPAFVQLYSEFMWSSHARLYDLPHLELIFIEKHESFNVMEDVYKWFRGQYLIEHPPPMLVSVQAQNPPSTRNPQDQGRNQGGNSGSQPGAGRHSRRYKKGSNPNGASQPRSANQGQTNGQNQQKGAIVDAGDASAGALT